MKELINVWIQQSAGPMPPHLAAFVQLCQEMLPEVSFYEAPWNQGKPRQVMATAVDHLHLPWLLQQIKNALIAAGATKLSCGGLVSSVTASIRQENRCLAVSARLAVIVQERSSGPLERSKWRGSTSPTILSARFHLGHRMGSTQPRRLISLGWSRGVSEILGPRSPACPVGCRACGPPKSFSKRPISRSIYKKIIGTTEQVCWATGIPGSHQSNFLHPSCKDWRKRTKSRLMP